MEIQTGLKWSSKVTKQADFITNIKYDEDRNRFIIIHEIPEINVIQGRQNIQHFNCERITQNCTFTMETCIYDAVFVQNKLLVSNRTMPVRLYSINPQNQVKNQLQWSTIIDKKPNSQLYLSPLQLSIYENTIVGGGKKFISVYDLNKFCVSRRIKQMNKKYISAVQLLDCNSLVAGHFSGELSFIDLRAEQNSVSIKPHVDFVTRIKKVPQKDNQLVTMARKDNYIYLWDNRKLDTFIEYFQQPLYKNQRTGLDISKSGSILCLGDQQGNICCKSLTTSQTIIAHKAPINKCISSICSIEPGLIYAIGQRQYPLETEYNQNGYLNYIQLCL